jgi:hypothetical protein
MRPDLSSLFVVCITLLTIRNVNGDWSNGRSEERDDPADVNYGIKGYEHIARELPDSVNQFLSDDVVQPPPDIVHDCSELRRQGIETNGVYTMDIGGLRQTVYCDMSGGDWLVIQRRSADLPREHFNRNWNDYVTGFGNPSGEFWLGNENIHLLTSAESYELRVDLLASTGEVGYVQFADFRVESASDNYKVKALGRYLGGTADESSLRSCLFDASFSTADRDNDNHYDINGASRYGNGWWFRFYGRGEEVCAADLNGVPLDTLKWQSFDYGRPLRAAEMKIRPRTV